MSTHDPFGAPQPAPQDPPAVEATPRGATATDPAVSRRQSRLAVALAVVPLLVTQVAAITLSVLVLGERDKHPRRKDLAGAALAISTVWLVAMVVAGVVVAVASSGSSDDDRVEVGATWNEDGTLDRAGSARLDQLRVGDCFYRSGPADAATGTPTEVTLRPCTAVHEREVYHAFTLADGAFPGEEDVLRRARGGCESAFAGWVGVTYEDSTLQYDFSLPTEDGWPADRLVTCVIIDPDGPTSGTTQGSAR